MSDTPTRERAAHVPAHTRSRADRAWAWAGALLAAGVSIAVNIAHAGPHKPSAFEVAELVKAGMPVPEQIGSWGFAAFAATLPIMVLIAAEQVARRLLGRATLPVMLGIGVCAYSLSFWHTVLLLASWGEPWPLRITGAVAVDGLAVASVIALWFASVRSDGPPADVRVEPVRTAVEPDTAGTVRTHPLALPDVRGRAEPVRTSGPDGVRMHPLSLPDAGRPDGVRPEPVRTVNGTGRPDGVRPEPVRTINGTARPGGVRPEPVRTVNGTARPGGVRTALAERPASGRTAWADAPASGLAEAEVWTAWESAGRPNDWPTLAALLGTNPEAARKRASRR